MLKVAVEGEPLTSDCTPALTPSTVNVTFPVACAVPAEGVTVAVTARDAPGEGVVVAGTSTVVVGVLATEILTEGEVDARKFVSPL
jgi:hypothetical protein